MVDGERLRRSEQVVVIGLLANVVLAIVKTAVGMSVGSQALLADGINSTVDAIYFGATLVLVRLAASEPDPEHPHGHAQSESIASLLIGAFIITTAVAIFYSSLSAAITGEAPQASLLALAVAVATIAAKVGLVAYTANVARATGNSALSALAVDHRNDIYAAGTVVVGVGGALLGYPALDSLAGAAVSFFILATGIGVVRDAAEDLMGTLPRGGLAVEIRNTIAQVQGVSRVGDVRAYRFGPYLVLQVEIDVDPSLSVEEGHTIAAEVEQTLMRQRQEVRQVYTHVNPAGTR